MIAVTAPSGIAGVAMAILCLMLIPACVLGVVAILGNRKPLAEEQAEAEEFRAFIRNMKGGPER